VAEVGTSDILDKAAQLVAESGKNFILILDRLYKGVSRCH
jgi:hypothetical protein